MGLMTLPRPLREDYGGSYEEKSASRYSHSVAKKARIMMPMTHGDHPVRGLQSTANAWEKPSPKQWITFTLFFNLAV